jgi:hypothetical protein
MDTDEQTTAKTDGAEGTEPAEAAQGAADAAQGTADAAAGAAPDEGSGPDED